MISFTIVVKDGGRTRIEGVEAEELGADELAEATELAHEMLAHLETIVRRQASRRATKARDA